MNECNWEPIDQFSSPDEYRRFSLWLRRQLDDGKIEEISVKNTYAGPLFEERWFRCKACGEVWRLVAPQDPFHGFWGAV